jgi:predicted kinase
VSAVSPPRLILICGLPGAGKTTLARRLALDHSALSFGADEWMIQLGIDLFDEGARADLEALQWQTARALLNLGRSVILEFGFWQREERDEKREGAKALGARVELYVLDVALEERWRRIEARNALRTTSEGHITRDQLEAYDHYFETPGTEEVALFDQHGDDAA